MDGISEKTRLEILAQCTGNVFDIIDSLRAVAERDQAHANVSLHGKAANEIERLRCRIAEIEAELQRVQDVSLRECGIGFVDLRILRSNAIVRGGSDEK